MHADSLRGPKRARTFWIIAFILAMAVAAALMNMLHLGPIASFALAIAAMALLIPMTRSVERAQADAGCITTAGKRYTRRFIVMTFAYVVALFAALGLTRQFEIDGALIWVLALLPTVPVMGMIWAIARLLVEETDEYQRMRMVRASLVATGVLLVAGTIWGFLEMFGLVPHLWLWLVMPVWAMGLGIGQMTNSWLFGEVGGC